MTASAASDFNAELIKSKSSRRSAVRSSAWLGEMGELLNPRISEYICCEAVSTKGNDRIR